MGLQAKLADLLIPPDLKAHFDKVEKPVGDAGYDPWGFKLENAKAGMAAFRWVHDKYFRVQSYGIENIPAKGRALVIANHGGQLPMDGLMIGMAIAMRKENPRFARAMIERFFPTVPILGNWLNSVGAVIGDPLNCEKMLEREEVIVVFPEGARGAGKLYKDAYQLERFGNGFMRLAMEFDAPIIPVGVVGNEETMPAVANIKPLAKLLGVPYVPVAPPMPLPAQMHLNFGEAMHFPNDDASEEEVAARVNQVKEAINGLIAKGLKERESIF
ncbi:MAG: lysophospholipid acyltransferase family protein [Gammaproteobacteria bacterium]|nr:lysophospholipid acyltransferase family protein [Gammaproteobacteria bacterium]